MTASRTTSHLCPDQADGHTTTLLRTVMFRIDDACCRRCASVHRSAGEAKLDYMVTFPRSGMNVRHVAEGTISLDPNTLAFANRNSPYQVSHPNGSGENAMNLAVRADVLRHVLHYSTLEIGLAMTPIAAIFALASPFAGRLADWVGGRAVTTTGGIAGAIGLGWIAIAATETPDFRYRICPSSSVAPCEPCDRRLSASRPPAA